MKIYAPVKNATGVWCNVQFRDGVGETENPHLIEWFRKHGYEIEVPMKKCEESVEVPMKKCDAEPDFESMTPNELRDWMKENGYGSKIKNIRNKEKLIEIIRG